MKSTRFAAAIYIICIILVFSVIKPYASFSTNNADINNDKPFDDIPEDHWAYTYVHHLRELNITRGIGDNKFGLGLPIKRNEFVTFLVRLMQWDLINPEKGSFEDNNDRSTWYFPYVETALKNGVILKDAPNFRPDDPITREEMAIMIVRALGYDNLAQLLSSTEPPFNDVYKNTGYIAIAKDVGIVKGTGDDKFNPDGTALREEAAAMMIRMHEKLLHPLEELHAFYAIKSYPQIDLMKSLDSVSFGWSRLEYDNQGKRIILNTTSKNNNEFYVPSGYSTALNTAAENSLSTQLMVFLKNEVIPEGQNENDAGISTAEYILTNPDIRKKVIEMINDQIQIFNFDGVVIDFENMKGEVLRKSFNSFLMELKSILNESGKKLYVAVHPVRKPGHEYFDAYDYKTIGNTADKIILMAHDYNAKQLTDNEMETGYNVTPLTPIDEIYFALKAITDKDTGVEDTSKILFQISFDSAQWRLQQGKILNRYALTPDYALINTRLKDKNTELYYSYTLENPYAKFTDGSNGTDNILWYEDSRSITAKIKLARLFKVGGISIWRLGNIPDFNSPEEINVYMNVWEEILKCVKGK